MSLYRGMHFVGVGIGIIESSCWVDAMGALEFSNVHGRAF